MVERRTSLKETATAISGLAISAKSRSRIRNVGQRGDAGPQTIRPAPARTSHLCPTAILTYTSQPSDLSFPELSKSFPTIKGGLLHDEGT